MSGVPTRAKMVPVTDRDTTPSLFSHGGLPPPPLLGRALGRLIEAGQAEEAAHVVLDSRLGKRRLQQLAQLPQREIGVAEARLGQRLLDRRKLAQLAPGLEAVDRLDLPEAGRHHLVQV